MGRATGTIRKRVSSTVEEYEIDYKYQKEEKRDHQRNKEKMFGVVLGQCQEGTKDLVKSDKTFTALQKGGDVVGLIRDLYLKQC